MPASSARCSPDSDGVRRKAGLLGEPAGFWHGSGFDLIARPDFAGKERGMHDGDHPVPDAHAFPAATASRTGSLRGLDQALITCRACPRLVAWWPGGRRRPGRRGPR
ncbi:hypothetical protein ACFQLX_15120 [Streptomyces polyrhachis]|uniref:Uncharacterized protein n=1 Tax=Streptomyces polyrhachis TaxID=1282885 RepID=A0ABW2GKU0_9ACTN